MDRTLEDFVAFLDEQAAVHVEKHEFDKGALDTLYKFVPFRVPRLFEQLLATYYWCGAECGGCVLFDNGDGIDCEPFVTALVRDAGLARSLLASRLFQFGKRGVANYDPICVDLRRRRSSGDAPIVQIAHEGILLDGRIRIVAEVSRGFREFLKSVSS